MGREGDFEVGMELTFRRLLREPLPPVLAGGFRLKGPKWPQTKSQSNEKGKAVEKEAVTGLMAPPPPPPPTPPPPPPSSSFWPLLYNFPVVSFLSCLQSHLHSNDVSLSPFLILRLTPFLFFPPPYFDIATQRAEEEEEVGDVLMEKEGKLVSPLDSPEFPRNRMIEYYFSCDYLQTF